MFRIVWLRAFGVTFDPWQEWLFRNLMELYPAGHPRAGELRARSAFVSVGRQNGKSEVAAVIGLWGLLRGQNAMTIGIASNVEQAAIVYDRARKAIALNPHLAKRFKRITGTRGIEAVDGSVYSLKPAKSASLQGLPVHTGVIDELHIVPPELWADLQNGTGARPNTFVFGITTAGSDDSELLKTLYENADKAVSGDPAFERFKAYIWQAPEARLPDDDAELLELLKPANPRLASGLVDPENFVSDVRGTTGGKAEIIRYRLNRFVSSVDSFLDLEAWTKCVREVGDEFPRDVQPIVCVDISPGRDFASISVSAKVGDLTHVKLIASIPRPTIETLLRLCESLAVYSPTLYAMDSWNLKELGTELKARGYPVQLLGPGDSVNGSAHFYALVQRKKLRHGGEPLLSYQLPRTKRKDKGDGRFRINPKESGGPIDAVLSTVGAAWMAEVTSNSDEVQVF